MPRTAEKNAGQAPRTGVSVRKKRKRRKSKRYVLHYFLLLAFCLAVAAIMCYTVFFKVEQIKVTGVSVYSEKQLVDLTGVSIGDSLFQIGTSNLERKITATLPYIRKVQVKRRLPTTLLVAVEEEIPMGAVYTGSGYAIISSTGKILETGVLSPPESVPRILGLEYETYEEGTYVNQKADKPENETLLPQIVILQELYEAMTKYDITFDYIDISDIFDVKAMYDGRLLINFGTQHKLDEKMNMIRNALDDTGDQFEKIPDEGTMDVTAVSTLRTRKVDILKLKDPKGYMEFGDGTDTSQIGQSENPKEEQSQDGTGPVSQLMSSGEEIIPQPGEGAAQGQQQVPAQTGEPGNAAAEPAAALQETQQDGQQAAPAAADIAGQAGQQGRTSPAQQQAGDVFNQLTGEPAAQQPESAGQPASQEAASPVMNSISQETNQQKQEPQQAPPASSAESTPAVQAPPASSGGQSGDVFNSMEIAPIVNEG